MTGKHAKVKHFYQQYTKAYFQTIARFGCKPRNIIFQYFIQFCNINRLKFVSIIKSSFKIIKTGY